MARLNAAAPWLIAMLGLLPPLLAGVAAAGRGGAGGRLVAVSFATAIASLLLVTASFAFDQPATIDLALALALLGLPGILLLAMFEERWL